MKPANVFDLAKLAAKAADDKLGKNIVAFDLRNHNAIADVYMFIGATSHIHVRALEDAIREGLRESGAQLLRTDGQRGHLWRVLDYGSLLVHVMEEKMRDFYAVERLWEQGKKIKLFKTDSTLPEAGVAEAKVEKIRPVSIKDKSRPAPKLKQKPSKVKSKKSQSSKGASKPKPKSKSKTTTKKKKSK